MADPDAGVVEGLDALLGDELADLLVSVSVLLGRGGHGVIEHDHEALRVLHPLDAELGEGLRDRGGVIVREAEVGLDLDDLPDRDGRKPRLLREHLLGKGQSHVDHPSSGSKFMKSA